MSETAAFYSQGFFLNAGLRGRFWSTYKNLAFKPTLVKTDRKGEDDVATAKKARTLYILFPRQGFCCQSRNDITRDELAYLVNKQINYA